MNKEEFIEKTAQFINKAYTASEKARREGILALEEYFDIFLLKERDIFEYGMRLVVDGTNEEIIEKILDNIINHYSDPLDVKYKTIQKGAVLYIQKGIGTRMMMVYLASFISNQDLYEVEKFLQYDIKQLLFDEK